MNIPNLLTILRIFFVPLLVAALVQEDVTLHFRSNSSVSNVWLALAIFLCAASTDLLDGYLARRWRQITTIGTLLDPIADKLLVPPPSSPWCKCACARVDGNSGGRQGIRGVRSACHRRRRRLHHQG